VSVHLFGLLANPEPSRVSTRGNSEEVDLSGSFRPSLCLRSGRNPEPGKSQSYNRPQHALWRTESVSPYGLGPSMENEGSGIGGEFLWHPGGKGFVEG